MDDMIDRAALLEKLREMDELFARRAANEDAGFLAVQVGITLASCEVGAAPTVDAEVVRHGRWMAQSWYDERTDKDRRAGYRCSICWQSSAVKYPGCPNCRAKMDAKEGETNDQIGQ